MAGKEYYLKGFGAFLDYRRVVFLEPLPKIRVCSVCEMVSSLSWLLPCCHVVCCSCKGQIAADQICALDEEKFDEGNVILLEFQPSQLDRYLVRCLSGGRKCGFIGKPSELREHSAQCTGYEVRCVKCKMYVARNTIVLHCKRCSGVSMSPSARAIIELAWHRGDLKKRRKESGEGVNGDFLNGDGQLCDGASE